VSDPAILYRLITLANDTTIVRQGDYLNLLGYISENRVGEPIVWDYVRDNWQKLVDRYLHSK
jgi:glutamyl aminopeptidase